MSNARLLSLLTSGEWSILPDNLHAVVEAVPQAMQARDAAPVEGTRNVTMRDSVAMLHIKGPLMRYHTWFTQFLGSSSYGELRKDLQSCIDANVQALMVTIDSPGGEVNGCKELADAFYAARSKIPNVACYVSGTGASAAYFLASAVGKVYCSPTAMVGSIGVITRLVDYSKQDAANGIKEYEIVSSQSPAKAQQPADADYRNRVQARIDALADVFVDSVAQYRGVPRATVLSQYGQGDVFVGQRAVDAGLADGISDAESVIAQLNAAVLQQKQQSAGAGSRSPFPGYTQGDTDGHQAGGEAPRTGRERDRAADRVEGVGAVWLRG